MQVAPPPKKMPSERRQPTCHLAEESVLVYGAQAAQSSAEKRNAVFLQGCTGTNHRQHSMILCQGQLQQTRLRLLSRPSPRAQRIWMPGLSKPGWAACPRNDTAMTTWRTSPLTQMQAAVPIVMLFRSHRLASRRPAHANGRRRSVDAIWLLAQPTGALLHHGPRRQIPFLSVDGTVWCRDTSPAPCSDPRRRLSLLGSTIVWPGHLVQWEPRKSGYCGMPIP